MYASVPVAHCRRPNVSDLAEFRTWRLLCTIFSAAATWWLHSDAAVLMLCVQTKLSMTVVMPCIDL